MRNIRNSISLKVLCYILIPILLVSIIVNIIVGIILFKDPDVLKGDNVYATKDFSNIYSNELNSLYNQISEVTRNIEYNEMYYNNETYYLHANYDEYINENNERIIYNIEKYDIEFDYVVVDTKNNIAYTNLVVTSNKNTIDSLIKNLKNESKVYWNFENRNIITNIDNLKKENIPYSDRLYEWIESNDVYEVYTTLNNTNGINGSIGKLEILYNVLKPISENPYQLNTALLTILVILLSIYLVASLGHKKGYKGIYLNWIDKIPLEFIIVLFFFGMYISYWIIVDGISYAEYFYSISSAIISLCFVYFIVAISLTTFIKRIKGKALIKNTFIYMITKWTKNLIKEFFRNTKLIVKLSVLYGGFVFIFAFVMLISATYFDFNFFTFLLFVFIVLVFIKLYNYTKNLYKIKMAIKKIYEGNNEIILNPDEMKGELKDVAIYVNDIAGGLSNAIEESIKSERFKTELITNVSHDIKTPLTSIINYVDLLKQEDVDNEKIKEYIQILDKKSQRLKKLTEDLVEASKASSGNVKLEMEKINIVELIKQATGEFEDKFKEKNLEIVTQIPKSEVNILADNKYIYRVIENLFSNISKYALEYSRVYIDVVKENERVKITMKNISKEALNITAEELMQRFVRGDKSRTTEGSGLGLSISKSLTELQNGRFDIQVDGDLFKVEITFDFV